MPDAESLLSRELRALLREPVDLGPAARARVMQRVRAAAALRAAVPRARGAVRATVLGALLAASFVVSIVTANARSGGNGTHGRTLADTIAVHFAAASDADWPVIAREKLVAVADVTHDLAPKPHPGAPARRN
ncbi:MAG TPA: hypothetical protein VHE78_04890 [Gemmatimonadaceae bacterium]|nr:hypothetical protein [Gemmatimonadaceae bacterium]